MAKQTKQAVGQRTQQRLAARAVAVQRASATVTTGGVKTRRRNREQQPAKIAAKKAALKKHEAELVAEAQEQQPEIAERQTKPASAAMATVALRGEAAQRLRQLAAAQQMSLSKLLVRMLEVIEAHAR